MSRTAHIFSDKGLQAIRLPEDIRLPGTEVTVRQDQHTGEITLTPKDQRSYEERQKFLDGLFKLAAEVPQEEWDLFDAALMSARTCPKCGA